MTKPGSWVAWAVGALLAALAGRVVWIRAETARALARERPVRVRPLAENALHELFSRMQPAVAGRREIGFAASRPPLSGTREDLMCYYVAQYALAPVLVSARPDGDLVLGAFDSDDELRAFAQRAGYRVAAQYAAGLALLERAQR